MKYCASKKSLAGKTTIVTGANTGLGYETALEFAKRGARVIMACRNPQRADPAREKIVAATGNENVVVKVIDMASLKSVRSFAEDITTNEGRLDILVNNAGAMAMPEQITEDGLQLTVEVNYFSPFLLTQLLLDLLKKSAPSRVVNVSSRGAGLVWTYKLEDINKFPGTNRMYCETKLCNILFTQELARRLENTGVTTYSLHPGVISTEFLRFSPALDTLGRWLLKTPEEGAQTQIYLSLQDGIENLSGEHFEDSKRIKPYCGARNPELAKELYEKSLEYVGLRKLE